MKELDDLLRYLGEWNLAGNDYEAERELRIAYRAYKAAPPPLVLEQVDYKDIKVAEVFLGWCNEMYMTFSKSANRIKNEQEGKCYRIPEERQ